MRNAALILGIIGGIVGMVVGFFGYGFAVLGEMFSEFLAEELGMESLSFLIDAQEWKTGYFDSGPATRLVRARRMYRVYIALDGQFTINIPARMSTMIKAQVEDETVHDVSMNIFDEAIMEVNKLLTIGSLFRFKQSPQFAHFVTHHRVKPPSPSPSLPAVVMLKRRASESDEAIALVKHHQTQTQLAQY